MLGLLVTAYELPLSCYVGAGLILFPPPPSPAPGPWFLNCLVLQKTLQQKDPLMNPFNFLCTFPHFSNFKIIVFSSPPERTTQISQNPKAQSKKFYDLNLSS